MLKNESADTTVLRLQRCVVQNARDLKFSRDDLPYAIVVGLNCMTGLQTARILSAHGVPVVGLAADPNHYCCQTRACESILKTATATDELVDTLVELGARLPQPAVLVPCADLSVLAISKQRERLSRWYKIGLPEHDVVKLLMDKLYTF